MNEKGKIYYVQGTGGKMVRTTHKHAKGTMGGRRKKGDKSRAKKFR